MQFEWDEDKRQEILRDRGIDILDAARMFNNPEAIELWADPRSDEDEKRVNAIGPVDGNYYELVFTERGKVIRLITAWKLNDKSKAKAQKRYARRVKRYEEERRNR